MDKGKGGAENILCEKTVETTWFLKFLKIKYVWCAYPIKSLKRFCVCLLVFPWKCTSLIT